ncbi:MAG: hypothetical protein V1899_03850 [Planctomycetota bacterium]
MSGQPAWLGRLGATDIRVLQALEDVTGGCAVYDGVGCISDAVISVACRAIRIAVAVAVAVAVTVFAAEFAVTSSAVVARVDSRRGNMIAHLRPFLVLTTNLSRRLRVLIILLIMAAVAGSGWLIFASKSSATVGVPSSSRTTGGEWTQVRRGDLEIKWSDEGELRPVQVTALSFSRWGKVSWFLDDGTPIKKGDKIFSLETKELEDTIHDLEQDMATAEKNLAQQQQTCDLEIKQLQTELLTKKDCAAVAQLKEQELLSHPTALDREEIQTKLEGAQVRLTAANAELTAFQPLAEKGYGTRLELDSKKINVEKTRLELDRVEMKTRAALAGAKPEDRTKAKLETENGALILKIKQINSDDQLNNLTAKARSAQRQVELIQRKLNRQKEQLEKSTIIAPHDGVVVHRVIGRHNNKKCEIGEYVGPGTSPVELPNYEKMKVRTQAPESFIRRLVARSSGVADGQGPCEGSPARVKVTTLPDRIYQANATWIDGWARDRNAKLSDADIKAQGLSGVRVFDVEVELKESDPQRLREGFRATVEFLVATLHDVLYIPVKAVSMRDGMTYVQALHKGKREWRKIVLGTQTLTDVVVIAGLDENDKVLAPHVMQRKTEEKKKSAPKTTTEATKNDAQMSGAKKEDGKGGRRSGKP